MEDKTTKVPKEQKRVGNSWHLYFIGFGVLMTLVNFPLILSKFGEWDDYLRFFIGIAFLLHGLYLLRKSKQTK